MNSGILKFSAEYLHDGRRLWQNKVLITDASGRILEIVPREAAGDEVQVFDGLLCPGLVNAHCHLELSHLWKKIPRRTGLVNFLVTVTQNRDGTSPEEIVEAAAQAEQRMLQNGIVAVGDISNKTDSIPVKRKRNLFYYTFVECVGFMDNNAPDRLRHAVNTCRSFRREGLKAVVVPHAPYSVSRSLFQLINDLGKGSVVSIHNQESAAEDELYRGRPSDFYRLYDTIHLDYSHFKPTQRSSLQSWLPYFDHRQPLILVHNTFTAEEDIRFAEDAGHTIYWCLCPNANIYIENRMPPVELLLKHAAKIVLGTDSLASNHQLSVLEEIKTLQAHFPALPLATLLTWATLNGAQALGCAEKTGSFEKGKLPGIVNIHPVSGMNGHRVSTMPETQAVRIK